MKKFLLLFSALSLFANVSSAAVGDTFDIEGVTYIVKSDDTAGIKKVQSSLTSVTLPEKVTNEGAEYSVVSVEDYALYYSNATSVKVPATVSRLVTTVSVAVLSQMLHCLKDLNLLETMHSMVAVASHLLIFLTMLLN